MSRQHQNSILAALRVLGKASEEELRLHRFEALLVLEKLRMFAVDSDDSNLSSTSRDDHNSASSSSDGHDDPTSSTEYHETPQLSLGIQDSSSYCQDQDSSLHPQDLSLRDSLHSQDLIEALKSDFTLISRYLTKSAFEAIKVVPVWINEEPRVVDLLMDRHRYLYGHTTAHSIYACVGLPLECLSNSDSGKIAEG